MAPPAMASKHELANLSPDEFLKCLEAQGMFEGNEQALEHLRKVAAKGIHPFEILSREPDSEQPLEPVLNSFDLAGVARHILDRKCKHIVVMCGAGISTSAGIPDFRTAGTGLYDNLQRFNLPTPQSMFNLDYFRDSPDAFYELAKEMWPGNFEPTPAHYFIKLLSEKGVLLRCYTQNIDSLERQAGIPDAEVVAVHGNFDSAHVIDRYPEVSVPVETLKKAIDDGEEGWKALREEKGGLVKPKIVFFGEEMPARFNDLSTSDFWSSDLLLVMGTSLVVQPFAGLLSKASRRAPRVLINREPAGTCDKLKTGLRFHMQEEGQNWRDVWSQMDCDSGCLQLAAALGWEDDLRNLIKTRGQAVVSKATWLDEDE